MWECNSTAAGVTLAPGKSEAPGKQCGGVSNVRKSVLWHRVQIADPRGREQPTRTGSAPVPHHHSRKALIVENFYVPPYEPKLRGRKVHTGRPDPTQIRLHVIVPDVRDPMRCGVYGNSEKGALRSGRSVRMLPRSERASRHLYYVHRRMIVDERAAKNGRGSLTIGGSHCVHGRR